MSYNGLPLIRKSIIKHFQKKKKKKLKNTKKSKKIKKLKNTKNIFEAPGKS